VEIREVRPEKYQEAGRITALAYRELRVGGIPGEGRGPPGSGAGENSAGCHDDGRIHACTSASVSKPCLNETATSKTPGRGPKQPTTSCCTRTGTGLTT